MSATCLCCDETKIYAKKMCNRCYVKDLRQRNKEKNEYRDMTISRLKEQVKELERII